MKNEEEEDLTCDLENPTSEPNIQEVVLPKPNPASRSQRDVETQPVKGGSLMDIEEEAENMVSNREKKILFSAKQTLIIRFWSMLYNHGILLDC